MIIDCRVLLIFFRFISQKSFNRSKVLNNLFMRIKYFGERIHSNVEIVFFDRAGLFMEFIVVTSQTVNRVN